MAKTVTVEIRLSSDVQREISRRVEQEMGALRDEIAEEATRIPLTTLADLLDFNQSESTPTWDAIFEAVETLRMEVRRG